MQDAQKEQNKNKLELRQKSVLLKKRDSEILILKEKICKLQKSKRIGDQDNTQMKAQLIKQNKELECLRRLTHMERMDKNPASKQREQKHDLLDEKTLTGSTFEDVDKCQREKIAPHGDVFQENAKKQEQLKTQGGKKKTFQSETHSKENAYKESKQSTNDIHDHLSNKNNSLRRILQEIEKNRKEFRISFQHEAEKLENSLLSHNDEFSNLQKQPDGPDDQRRSVEKGSCNEKLSEFYTRPDFEADEHDSGYMKRELGKPKTWSKGPGIAKNKSPKQVCQCQREVNPLKSEMKNIRAIYTLLRKDLNNIADSRHKQLQTQRELSQERIKARALLDEMITPMNVHRWRILGGKDPERTNLIKQKQLLRKQILYQHVSALKKEQEFEESQYLYESLKTFVIKLPRNKIKEFNEIRNLLSRKDKKLKAVLAETQIANLEDRSKELELENMRSKLVTAKTNLTTIKKQKQRVLEELKIRTQGTSTIMQNSQSGYKTPSRILSNSSPDA